ncbi:hypothetical protein Cgig2_007880 [Carnegiea gigantea]|uniref:Glutaminyl-peptide cyclotransferase n=1 Tax=Carnegiea gigantea TaxID=171969 RepID=A0A9Q1KF26_9CARY|nr:hypothetical protein Cgig2_007880 [Carnegiea gigantea]
MAGGGSLRRKKTQQRSNPNSVQPFPMLSQSPLHRYKWLARVVFAVLALSLLVLLGNSSSTWFAPPYDSQKAQLPQIYTIEVVKEYPHDRRAFTQGLLYWGNDTLYESTGLYGKSSVRRVALQTGKVEAQQKMDDSYFGEGLTLLGERLYQVTWLKKTGFIYDRNNLSKMMKFTHDMKDGWGLATDGKILFGSDVIQKHTVRYEGLEVHNLNELEFVNGEVWANVWQTDCIARIAPGDGTVSSWILLPSLRESLVAAGERGLDVLNGIAWDADKQRIFVTGKLWPTLYEIRLRSDQSHDDIQQLCIRPEYHF